MRPPTGRTGPHTRPAAAARTRGGWSRRRRPLEDGRIEPLIGRDTELARLQALVAGVREGAGTALLVLGEPGIGKTSLVREALGRAPGVRVLRATGFESESELAFAGLTQLLTPVLGALEEIPAAQAGALRAALALGPPVVMDRFAAYAATLAVLLAAARDRPLLVVVDDAHWLDAPTTEALTFCARRLGDDPVGLVIVARPVEGAHLRGRGLPEWTLGALDDTAAQALLDAHAAGLAPGVRARLLALAEGNPLALVELPGGLDDDERAGRRALREPLRPGEAITDAFGRRVTALPAPAREAMTLLAASREGRAETVRAALDRRGLPAGALEPALADGLVAADDDRLVFRHPLLRPVCLALARPGEVRAAHRALAEVLDPRRDAEVRGWHLAEAALGPDDEAAAALEMTAGMAAARTGYAAGARAMERAAILSTSPDAAAARRLAAGQMAQAAGRTEWAVALLDRALADVRDPLLRGQIAHARGFAALLSDPLDEVFRFMTAEAERLASDAPIPAAAMLADAVLTQTMAGRCHTAIQVARRAAILAGAEPDTPPSIPAFLAGSMVMVGAGREGRRRLVELTPRLEGIDPLSPLGHTRFASAQILAWLGDARWSGEVFDEWLQRMRETGSIGLLGVNLAFGSELDFIRGLWDRAAARAEEAIALLEETGQFTSRTYALCRLAYVEAPRGQRTRVGELTALAERDADVLGAGSIRTYAHAARGHAALACGDPEAAITELEPLVSHCAQRGLREPAVVGWQPDHVEALIRLGRPRESRTALSVLAEQAHATGGAWARAATCRCRGLIDREHDRHFQEALALHALDPRPFETARTRLAYGTRLRRDRRRGEARVQVEQALEVFERLRATPWTERARTELEALGVTRRPSDPARRDELTPRERQIALAVTDGLTNREIAARLFLSEKTVERHLVAVYAKLGVRSRTELVGRLAAGA